MKTLSSVLRSLWLRRFPVTLAVVLVLVLSTLAATYVTFNLPGLTLDRQQTLVFGPTQFSPSSPGAVRVLVRDQNTGQPVKDAQVSVRLMPKGGGTTQTLYSGQTDTHGTVPVSFAIPANTARDQLLVIETQSNAGHDRIEKTVTVQRAYRVLVTTDKPLYQPGQIIHLRALALDSLDRTPAKSEGLEFLVQDPKGNKVYRKTVPTSAFGVASTDFALAETVNSGTYKITASLGDTKSEKSVTVKPYVLPKFKVTVETERGYYLPGERVTGHIRADYFFGKPVAQGDVMLKGIVYDVERAETVSLSGQTGADGNYAFAFNLPNYFAGRGLDKNRADFALEVSVTDQARQTEQTSLVLPISQDAILIDAVPESGKLVADVENIVYVLTSLPDGSPVETDLTVQTPRTNLQAHAGKYGLAEIRLTPSRGTGSLTIAARDAQGRRASRTLSLQSETSANQILLRADRATYRVGETMHLDLLTAGGVGTVYVDLIKEGQTFSTRAVDSVNGRATLDLDVTAELIGTVQLHAYHVERNSTIVRDTRVVVVEQPSDLNISIKADRDSYRPGETSRITFDVTNRGGKGVLSALGLTAVDESVFALAEQDPGFAKLYFLLQKELLEPKYQVKGFQLPDVVSPTNENDSSTPSGQLVRAAQDRSAQAAWAGAVTTDLSLRANSQIEKRDAATRAQANAFDSLTGWLAILLSTIPLGIGGLVMAGLKAKKILSRSIALAMGGLLVYCVISPFLIGGIMLIGMIFTQARMGVVLVALIALAWLVSYGILVSQGIVKRDTQLLMALLLLAVYLVFVGTLAFVAGRATNVGEWTVFFVIVTYLAGLAALILLGIGYLVQKEWLPGFASIFLALLFIPATALLAMLPTAGPLLQVMGNPAIYMPTAYLTGCAAPPRGASSNAFRDLQKGLGSMGETGAMPAALPTATAAGGKPSETSQASAAAPRLRQFFPETLYVNPQAITDENGRAVIDIPLADSITTWRLAATASSQRGELGATSAGLRVFQDFFVDLDLPVALTQNDEVSVPVAVYNYLPQSQQVRLVLDQPPWFTLQDQAEKTLTIASNDIDVVYFRIKASAFGMQKLKVTAYGDKMSDAIQREIRVYPDGKQIEATESNWLKGDVEQVVQIPAPAIPGASRVEVKIYPGVMSQAVNGLENLLHMPYG